MKKLRYANPRARGFTMVEVMVSLIVISIGLLGVAKMQALALSSTNTSRLRGLAAIEAASLSASMHVNRAYWAKVLLTQPIAVAGSTVTTTDATMSTALTAVTGSTPESWCLQGGGHAPCAVATMAAADVKAWANEMNRMLPNATATITCPTTSTPTTCTIVINWIENTVAINSQGTSTGNAFQTPTYTLFVEP